MPSCDWRLLSCITSNLKLFPPKVGVIIKLKQSHGDYLLVAIVVHAEDLVDLECPQEVFFGVIGSGELGHCELELAKCFFLIAVTVAIVAMLMIL